MIRDVFLNDVDVASREVVSQAARDFAAALRATPQFVAFEAAAEMMGQDAAAQEVIHAFQAKQEEMEMLQTRNAITAQDRAEFESLRKNLTDQPSVSAYFQAQADLVEICQAAGDLLTERTGFNFGSSACSSGCCG